MNHDYDILIVGGGMVGASMACALAPLPLRIGLIEAFPFRSEQQPSYDVRAIALAQGSQRIIDSMGLWPDMQPGATPILDIHISDRGHFGVTRLNHREEGVAALGYVVESRFVGQALKRALDQQPQIEQIIPARLTQLQTDSQGAQLTIEQNGEQRQLSARLVIAADGGDSVVRQQLQIDTHKRDYQQTAVICTVSSEKKHQHVAYERFTDSGPLALLPLSENRLSLVYTVKNDQLDTLMALDDEAFLAQLQQRFGFRLGRFTRCSARTAYPLALMRIERDIAPSTVFIGNAAHTVHPVAGQGFNLGIRDVATLAELIADAVRNQQDIGSDALLRAYSQWRDRDQRDVARFTDSLIRIFTNPLGPVEMARSKALGLTNLIPPIKHALARQAMGLRGRLPRLSRGLPL
ncbi:MAG: 2-octaprenyl-6-methoxyphenyl hydroxylase [Gammaproteobacteria bacterium]|nr:2-octaprenyl-6-methoxyphenyl hydroxylase [Gammaproteobacteria bacterium]